jgi:sugar phosphate isomerase/epimerase
MLVQIPIGIANSVSYNLDYDPMDTIRFMGQSGFDLIQIYFNKKLINDTQKLQSLIKQVEDQSLSNVYFHAAGEFNQDFLNTDYRETFNKFLENFEQPRVIYHFDENEELESMLQIVDKFAAQNRVLYLENFFQGEGIQKAEKNLRKFTAVFSLVNNLDTRIYPVIDIPRFFHQKLKFTLQDALGWCYQILNFFGNRDLPVLLHLIDSHKASQERNDFCPVGQGYIPYQEIFKFISKNQVAVEGIILEYLDKVNTLQARDNLLKMIE